MNQHNPYVYAVASLHLALEEATATINLLSGCDPQEIKYRLLCRAFDRIDDSTVEELHQLSIAVVKSTRFSTPSAQPQQAEELYSLFDRRSA